MARPRKSRTPVRGTRVRGSDHTSTVIAIVVTVAIAFVAYAMLQRSRAPRPRHAERSAPVEPIATRRASPEAAVDTAPAGWGATDAAPAAARRDEDEAPPAPSVERPATRPVVAEAPPVAEPARLDVAPLPVAPPARAHVQRPPSHDGPFHVSVEGDDANDGTADAPFRTLERARDAVRLCPARGKKPVEVVLAAGRYTRTRTFDLGDRDGGAPEARVVYRAAGGAEVRISGAKRIASWRQLKDERILQRLPEDARGKVVVADLARKGIADAGRWRIGRWGHRRHYHVANGPQLYYDGSPMQLARWPNGRWSRVDRITDKGRYEVRGTPASHVGTFHYAGNRPERWVGESDLWTSGYWCLDYAQSRQPIRRIDTDENLIELDSTEYTYGYRAGQRYHVFNCLAELDRPGEYKVDSAAGAVYFWPPTPLDQGVAEMSVLADPMLSLREASHVVFDHIVFETTRSLGAIVRGGSDVAFVGCTFRNLGDWAIAIEGGSGHRVTGCDIYDVDQGGIEVDGGDRRTLTASGHVVENCHITRIGRWNQTYRNAVLVNGCGVTVRHCLMHDLPHAAIRWQGNDHVFEYNEIHSVCHQVGEAGPFYSCRDWSSYGVQTRFNYVHHIGGAGNHGTRGVHLDDNSSGMTIYGNVFHKVPMAVLVGGGRDNTIRNNIFNDCRPTIYVDYRGKHVGPGGTLRKNLAKVPHRQAPWSTKYPRLATILEDDPAAPKNNVIERNICFGSRILSANKQAKPYVRCEGNVVDENGELQMAARKGHLVVGLPREAARIGFEPLPLEEMGLYEDAARASWPVAHEVIMLKTVRRATGTHEEIMRESLTALPARVKSRPFGVPRARSAVKVDGVLNQLEWRGAAPMAIRQDAGGKAARPASRAWLMRDAGHLYVAADHLVGGEKELALGKEWGPCDAMELAFQRLSLEAPVIALRGFASGELTGTRETDAPADAVRKSVTGVRYATCAGRNRWTAEWKIPFSSLGIDPGADTRVLFNLSVRKAGNDLWLMWRGTGHHTFDVRRAGLIVLAR